MSAPLSPERAAAIAARHTAVEGGGWYLAPEPSAAPGTVRATIDGYPRTIAVMDFRGWKAEENRAFVLSAHDDIRELLADRASYADRTEMAARIKELELALSAGASWLRWAATHVGAGQVPDIGRLQQSAEGLDRVGRHGIEGSSARLFAAEDGAS